MHRNYSPVSPHAATTGARGLDRLIAALRAPACYPHAVENVELLQTHTSCILLAGDCAYKIKKPVNLGFLDFSTLGARRHYCDEELPFLKRSLRDRFAQFAHDAGASFAIASCTASAATLRTRVVARERAACDAPEAGLAVLEQQLATEEPLAADEAGHALASDAEHGAGAAEAAALAQRLGLELA